MSLSHRIAYEWIMDYYDYISGQIKINKKTPDFICSDGKRFEAKYLYVNTLIFTESQILQLLPDDYIVVVDSKKVVDNFLWKDRHTKTYNFVFNDATEKVFFFKDKELLKDINKIILDFDSPEDALRSFVNTYKTNPLIFKSQKPEFM